MAEEESLQFIISELSKETGETPAQIIKELGNHRDTINKHIDDFDYTDDIEFSAFAPMFDYTEKKGPLYSKAYRLYFDNKNRAKGMPTYSEAVSTLASGPGYLSQDEAFEGRKIGGFERRGGEWVYASDDVEKDIKSFEEITGESADPEKSKLDTTAMPPLMKGMDADSNSTAPYSDGTTEAENMQRGVTGSTENPNPRSKVKDQSLVEKQRGVERDAKSKEIDAKAKEAGRAPMNQDLLTQFNLTFKDKAGNWQGPLSGWSSIDKAKEKFGDKIDSVESMNTEGRDVWDRWIYHNIGHDKNTRSGIKEQQMKQAEESKAIEEKRANGFTDEDIERGYKYGKRDDLGATGPVGERGVEGLVGGAYDAGSPRSLEDVTADSSRFAGLVKIYLKNGRRPEDILKEFESRAMRPPMPGDQEVTDQDVEAVKGLLGMPTAPTAPMGENPLKSDIASVAARAANLPQMTMEDPGAGVKVPMRPLDQIGDKVTPSRQVSPPLDVAGSDSGVASKPAPPPSFDAPESTGLLDQEREPQTPEESAIQEAREAESPVHTRPEGIVFNDPKQRKLDFDNARNPYSSQYDPSTSTPASPVEPVHTPPSGRVFNDPKLRKQQTVDNPYSSQYNSANTIPAPAPSMDVPVPQSPSFTGATPETFSFQGEPAATPQLEPLEEVMAQEASAPVEDEATRQARVQAEADFDNAMTVRRQGDAPVDMPRIEVTDNGLAYNEETGTYRDLEGNPLSENATTGADKLSDASEWSQPMSFDLNRERAMVESRRQEGESRNVAERRREAAARSSLEKDFLNDTTPSSQRRANVTGNGLTYNEETGDYFDQEGNALNEDGVTPPSMEKPFYDRRIQLNPETGMYENKEGAAFMPNFDGSGGRPSFTEINPDSPAFTSEPVSAEGEDAQRLLQSYRNRGVPQPELDTKADLLKMSRMPKYERDAYFKQKMGSLSDLNPKMTDYSRNMRDPNFNPFENPRETRRMMNENSVPAINRVPTVEQNAEKTLAQNGVYRPGSRQSLRLLGFSDDEVKSIEAGKQAALQAQSYKAKRPRLLNAFSA